MDQLRVIARRRCRDGRELQPQQIFRAAKRFQPGMIGQKILQCRGVGLQALGDPTRGGGENLAMHRVIEVIGFDQVIDPVQHIIRGQDCAQKLLFRFDIMRQIICFIRSCRRSCRYWRKVIH